jgi:hypothetical protein
VQRPRSAWIVCVTTPASATFERRRNRRIYQYTRAVGLHEPQPEPLSLLHHRSSCVTAAAPMLGE